MHPGMLARQIAGLALWLIFVMLAGIIARNSLGYFHAPSETAFFEDKAAQASNPAWRGALYIHAAAGITCLLASMLQFFRAVRVRHPGIHRWMGRIYSATVLWALCPSGWFLGAFAKGGAAGQSGFFLLGALTFYTTWRGVRVMKSGRVAEHARWMIRSFAMITTAITFRLWQVALFEAGLSDETNYIASLWLSIAGNAAVAEWAARRIPIRTQHNENSIRTAGLHRAGDPVRQPLRAATTTAAEKTATAPTAQGTTLA
jgi:uncharacterized membrane protein